MLTEYIDNLSEFLTIDYSIIPNVITFIIVVILILLALKSGLEFKAILLIYGIAMTLLTILGIDSVFNILTILETLVTQLLDYIFFVGGVIYA